MQIHDFEARLARGLLAWGAASVAGGVAMAVVGGRTGDRFVRAFGTQTIGWGAIDAALALGGAARARRRRATPPDDPASAGADAARVRRILVVNAGLDVLYIAGGLAVAAGRGRDGQHGAWPRAGRRRPGGLPARLRRLARGARPDAGTRPGVLTGGPAGDDGGQASPVDGATCGTPLGGAARDGRG